MVMLKSYSVNQEQEISFKNGEVKIDGGSNEERIVKTTQLFFRKLLKGKIAVAVNELDQTTYKMEIGAYEEVTAYKTTSMPMNSISPRLSIGIGSGIGLGGMGIGYGNYGYPGYYPYNNYGFDNSSSTSIYVTYFQSLLNIEDLNHVEGIVPQDIREKVSTYQSLELENRDPELFNVTPTYKGLVLGYYIKNKSQYNLVEFVR
jgi:hypothetical protein